MRLGLFVATFSAVLFVIALAMPLPYGPPRLRGGVAPTPGTPGACFRLAYDYEQDTEPLPYMIELHSAPDSTVPSGWWRADVGADAPRGWRRLWWRPAGPDSLDVTWHHGPVLRLPADGARRIGRMAPAGVAALIWWPFHHDYRTVADSVACPRQAGAAT